MKSEQDMREEIVAARDGALLAMRQCHAFILITCKDGADPDPAGRIYSRTTNDLDRMGECFIAMLKAIGQGKKP